MTLAPGAGHGGEGDASLQGPAQDDNTALIEAHPAQPKPTHPDAELSEAAPSSAIELNVIEFKTRLANKLAADEAAGTNDTGDLAIAHPKPAKRKNARERARERLDKKYAKDGTTPETTAKAKSGAKLRTQARKLARTESKAASKAASKAEAKRPNRNAKDK